MATFRRVVIALLGPDARTASNLDFLAAATPLGEAVTARLRRLPLPARYTTLVLWLRPETAKDEATHWRFEDEPTMQSESAHVTLPATFAGWSERRRRELAAAVLLLALSRLGTLRGWPAGTARELAPASAASHPDPIGMPIVYDAPPQVFISGGGGPANDPRTHPYLARNGEHVELFNSDEEWWAWWTAIGPREVRLQVRFEGRSRLVVRAGDELIDFDRVRPAHEIPADPTEARALADADLQEALTRLTERLRLPAHPRLQ